MQPEIYYDPYDFDVDTDPYPVWKRMRDEAPLYYNERYDFFALSREPVGAVTFQDPDGRRLGVRTRLLGD
jgi:hypothetical protein